MANRNLPPLKSLVYFEAAARLQSFTAASAEFNVTQGAVSRQIRQLEDMLGRPLFKRDRRQVVLTDDGHNYYVSVVDVLNQLFHATRQLAEPSEQGNVTLVTSSALASMYLLPRISEFRRIYPDIQIRIVARDDMADGLKAEHDLSLYYLREPERDRQVVLFTEEVFPVCSPEYLSSNHARFNQKLGVFSDLIWLESGENWIDWPEWLERMSLDTIDKPNRLQVNHYSMVIQAAIAGQGIALAWSGLVDTMIHQKLLVAPTKYSLKTEAGFVLTTPPRKITRPDAEIFRQWLIEDHRAEK